MEWPSIVTSFFAQQSHSTHPHHEGINYAPLLSLGNQQMVNFESSGSVISGNCNVRNPSRIHRQLNLSNAEAIHQTNQNRIHPDAAHVHQIPEPELQPRVSQNNDPIETDEHSSRSSSRHPASSVPVPEQKSFACKNCGEVLQNEEALSQHLRFFHKDIVPFPCELCNDKFEKRSLLQNHMRKTHRVDAPKNNKKVIKLDNGFFGCDLCDRTFDRQFKVYAHRKTHFPQPFACTMCDRTFFEKKYMLLHIETHKRNKNGKKELAFFCQQCEKSFALERTLTRHVQVIHKGNKPFKCHLCESSFWKYTYLKSHCKKLHDCEPSPKKVRLKKDDKVVKYSYRKKTERGHRREPKFICEFCSQDYVNEKVFILHRQTHLGVEKKTPCWLCTEYFINEDKMNEHLKEIHNQEAIKHATRTSSGYYECQDCDDVFKRSTKYYLHRLKKHDEKRIVCSFCQKGFVNLETYKCHRNIHVGAKPHLCPYCKVGFANRASLNGHVIKSHYKYNPFWCGACNKIYASEDMFKTHKEEHEGSAAFMCRTCYKGFDDEKERDKHESGFHKPMVDKKYTCHQCRKGYASPKLLKQHIKICNKPKLRRFKCKFCSVKERRYSFLSSLKQHYKKCHKNANKLRTEPSASVESVSDTIKNIPENVTEIRIKEDYVCKSCLFPFPNRLEILKHVNEKHPNNVPETSIICCFINPDEERHYDEEDKLLLAEPEVTIKLLKFYCAICKIPYCSPSLLDSHVTKYHPSFLERFKELNEEMTKLRTSTRTLKKKIYTEDINAVVDESVDDDSDPKLPLRRRRKNSAKLKYFSCKTCETSGKSVTYHLKFYLNKHIEKYHNNYPDEDIVKKNHKVKKTSDKDLTCSICDIKFHKTVFLEKHVEKYHPIYPEKSAEELAEKNDTSQGASKKYKCPICPVSYSLEPHWVRHMEIFHPNYNSNESTEVLDDDGTNKYECKFCKIEYAKEHCLSKHIEKFHPNYYENKELEDEQNGANFYCKVCNLPYLYRNNLENHIQKYHPDYYMVYTDDYRPLDTEKDVVTGKDSTPVLVEEVPPIPTTKPIYPQQDTLATASTSIRVANTDHHHRNSNLQAESNRFSTVSNSQTQSRGNCLYQQPRPAMERKSHQTSGFENSFLQFQANAAATNNRNEVNPSNYSNYNNPCEALNFLDSNLRDEEVTVEPNANFNRERGNFFENNIVPTSDFSYWDRGINQPVANNVAASSYEIGCNYNPSERPAFGGVVSTAPTYPIIPTVSQDSVDDPFDIPDTGFGLNYVSEDSREDPKDNDKKVANDRIKKAVEPKMVKCSKKAEEDKIEDKKKLEQMVQEAKAKAFFCKKCPTYYMRDYLIDKHYQKEHPDYWKELQIERANKKKQQNEDEFVLNDDLDELGKGSLECKICNNLYNSESRMLKHYKNIHVDHPDVASFVEELENLIWKDGKTKEEYKHVCDLCNKAYQRKLTLQRHYNTAHMNMRPYSCKECDKAYASKHSMDRHLQSVHINPDNVLDCEINDAEVKRTRSRRGPTSRNKKFKDSASDSQEEWSKPTTRRNTRARRTLSKSKEFVESDRDSSQDREISVRTVRKKIGRKVIAKKYEEWSTEMEDELSNREVDEESKVVKEDPKLSNRSIHKIKLKEIECEDAVSDSDVDDDEDNSIPSKNATAAKKSKGQSEDKKALKRKIETEESGDDHS